MSDAPGAAGEPFSAAMRDGVLWIGWQERTSVSDDAAAALVGRANALAPDVCPPMLVELNGMVCLSRGALILFARTLNIAAMAIIGPSAVDRTLAAFFTEVHHPPYPTRHFDHRSEGLAWLTDHPHAG
ncbi:STAS/SEC14 domain-containing protein [Arthrobacter sp. B0490]|uniref:DUF7793 family protein n=1 Tax=Arthrobacter sp. B0490 TaxID=2058891 RepID=UPI000CE3A0D8|nr:STAS/SEC14 domain-containing protein [Arthrobacter sp. B0490]